eukprot:11808371-Alexandrium_andersonii.AAC.1
MSASLVGSEMCIRDRCCIRSASQPCLAFATPSQASAGIAWCDQCLPADAARHRGGERVGRTL